MWGSFCVLRFAFCAETSLPYGLPYSVQGTLAVDAILPCTVAENEKFHPLCQSGSEIIGTIPVCVCPHWVTPQVRTCEIIRSSGISFARSYTQAERKT
jgi:hypothetical protein